MPSASRAFPRPTGAADLRLSLALTNDTSIGVMRYADAGYAEAVDEPAAKGIDWFA
jgi:urocanate hydratase